MIRLVVPDMGDEEADAVSQVLASGYLVQGQNVQRFEEMVAEYLNVDHVVAVSSGTAALHLSVLALDLGPGDEVIVPDFTFPATANVVAQVGAQPILADVSLATFNVDPVLVEPLITPRTRAIMPVHLFGLAAPMHELRMLAERYGLWLIEDAACALGAESAGLKCGTLGLLGCFSLHPRKAITTGEGGLIATRDAALANRLRSLRNHGMVSGPHGAQFVAAGLNYRMTDFQGALGVVQMGRLEKSIVQRRSLAAAYDEALSDLPWLARPANQGGKSHIYQSYVVLLAGERDRAHVMASLRGEGIECTIGTYACHAQPYFQQRYGYHSGDLPNSYNAFRRTLTLPLHVRMSSQDVNAVAEALRRAVP
jgi:perosamine synthetase